MCVCVCVCVIWTTKSLSCVFSEKATDWTNEFKLEISSLTNYRHRERCPQTLACVRSFITKSVSDWSPAEAFQFDSLRLVGFSRKQTLCRHLFLLAPFPWWPDGSVVSALCWGILWKQNYRGFHSRERQGEGPFSVCCLSDHLCRLIRCLSHVIHRSH